MKKCLAKRLRPLVDVELKWRELSLAILLPSGLVKLDGESHETMTLGDIVAAYKLTGHRSLANDGPGGPIRLYFAQQDTGPRRGVSWSHPAPRR